MVGNEMFRNLNTEINQFNPAIFRPGHFQPLFRSTRFLLVICLTIVVINQSQDKLRRQADRKIIETVEYTKEDDIPAPAITICPSYYPTWFHFSQYWSDPVKVKARIPATVREIEDAFFNRSIHIEENEKLFLGWMNELEPKFDPQTRAEIFPDELDEWFYKVNTYMKEARNKMAQTDMLDSLFLDLMRILMNISKDKRVKKWLANRKEPPISKWSGQPIPGMADFLGIVMKKYITYHFDAESNYTQLDHREKFKVYLADLQYADIWSDWPTVETEGCVDYNGKSCQFPFIYQNKTYNGCVDMMGFTKPTCAISVLRTGDYGQASECDMSKCELDSEGSEDVSFIDDIPEKTCYSKSGIECQIGRFQGNPVEGCFLDLSLICNTDDTFYVDNFNFFGILLDFSNEEECSVECIGIPFFILLAECKEAMETAKSYLADLHWMPVCNEFNIVQPIVTFFDVLKVTNIKGGNERLMQEWVTRLKRSLDALRNIWPRLSSPKNCTSSLDFITVAGEAKNNIEAISESWEVFLPYLTADIGDKEKYKEMFVRVYAAMKFFVSARIHTNNDVVQEQLMHQTVKALKQVETDTIVDNGREILEMDSMVLFETLNKTLPINTYDLKRHLIMSSFIAYETLEGLPRKLKERYLESTSNSSKLPKTEWEICDESDLRGEPYCQALVTLNTNVDHQAGNVFNLTRELLLGEHRKGLPPYPGACEGCLPPDYMTSFPICYNSSEDNAMEAFNDLRQRDFGCGRMRPQMSSLFPCLTVNGDNLNQILADSDWTNGYTNAFRQGERARNSTLEQFIFVYDTNKRFDVFGSSDGIPDGFLISVHGPEEVAHFDEGSRHSWAYIPSKSSGMLKFDTIRFKGHAQTVTEQFAQLPFEDRGCYVPGKEVDLRYFKKYSKTNCQVECIWEHAAKSCGCLPWFIPNPVGYPICLGLGNACFHNSWRDTDKDCYCPDVCSRVDYSLELDGHGQLFASFAKSAEEPKRVYGYNGFNYNFDYMLQQSQAFQKSSKDDHTGSKLDLNAFRTQYTMLGYTFDQAFQAQGDMFHVNIFKDMGSNDYVKTVLGVRTSVERDDTLAWIGALLYILGGASFVTAVELAGHLVTYVAIFVRASFLRIPNHQRG